MTPVNVILNTYIDFGVENNDKDPQIEVGNHIKISKHEKLFAKVYASNWSEEVFVIKKVKNTVLWAYVIEGLNGEKIVGMF